MNQLKSLLAIGAVAALAAAGCTSSSAPPPDGSRLETAASAQDLVAGLSLRIDSYNAALVGDPFVIDVSFRNAAGQLISSTDVITLSLTKNNVAAPLGGTLSVSAVNGTARFSDLVIATPGPGYRLVAATATAPTAISAPFTATYSEDEGRNTRGTGLNITMASAQPISPNVPLFGRLGPDPVHYFKFFAKAGALLTLASYANRLDMNGWDTSLRLRLIAPDQVTEIARSGAWDFGATRLDTGFSLVRLPTEGTYYVAASMDQGGYVNGNFALLLRLQPSNANLQTEAEPSGTIGQNDTMATAQALQRLAAGVIYGHYDPPAPGGTSADFYKVALTANTRVRVDLNAARNGGAYGDKVWDGRLDLLGPTGATLWANDNTYAGDPAVDYIVTTAGTYYVRVSAAAIAGNTGSAPYFLSYALPAYAPVAEGASNTSSASATSMIFGTDYAGTFTAAGVHWFAFGGTAGDVVRLTVQDRTQLQSATLAMGPGLAADAVLLADDHVTPLPAGIVTSTNSQSRFNVRQTILPNTGTYFVRVSSTTAGKFGLRLEKVAAAPKEIEPNDTPATATPIGNTGWASGTISSATDKDHFRVRANAGQLVTAAILAAPGGGIGSSLADWGSALLPTIEVRDSKGALLAKSSADRKGDSNFCESVTRSLPLLPNPDAMVEASFRAPAGGDYTIAVSDADGQGGPAYFYALRVWVNQ